MNGSFATARRMARLSRGEGTGWRPFRVFVTPSSCFFNLVAIPRHILLLDLIPSNLATSLLAMPLLIRV